MWVLQWKTHTIMGMNKMPATTFELKKIAALASLEIDINNEQQCSNDLIDIMSFVEQLLKIDTTNIVPLSHPLALHQRLRSDVSDSSNCVHQLADIAPLFRDDLYLVPNVIITGK